MINSGEKAYAYAKACGIIGKSFVGRRLAALKSTSRLAELDRLVFGIKAGELPERELLPSLEERFLQRCESAIAAVIKSYKNPPELLTLLMQEYNRKENPKDDKPKDRDALPETSLDREYYTKLWNSLKRLKKGDCRAAEKILTEEIALRNCAWALRLRTYYRMKSFEAEEYLVEIEGAPQLCRDALAALNFSLDDYSDWEGWKRAGFLNPPAPSWRADPRYFQNVAAEYLYRLALRNFRMRPSTTDAIFCFIKLKQFEEDILTSSAEGLSMGMTGRDVFTMLEVSL